jgi:hypothetical protein
LNRGKSNISSALLKYGYSQFRLEILEYCDRSELIKREQYYIDLLKPEYNISAAASPMTGRKHSSESIELIRLSALSRKRTKLSAEAKANIGLANPRSVPVIVTNNITGEIKEYPNKSQAGKALGISDT